MKFVYEWLLGILKYDYYHCMKMSMNGIFFPGLIITFIKFFPVDFIRYFLLSFSLIHSASW